VPSPSPEREKTSAVPIDGAVRAMLDLIATDERAELGHLRDAIAEMGRSRARMLAAAAALRAVPGPAPAELSATLATLAVRLDGVIERAARRTTVSAREILARLPAPPASHPGDADVTDDDRSLARACALILIATSGMKIARPDSDTEPGATVGDERS
jgi:hypothetical protein